MAGVVESLDGVAAYMGLGLSEKLNLCPGMSLLVIEHRVVDDLCSFY